MSQRLRLTRLSVTQPWNKTPVSDRNVTICSSVQMSTFYGYLLMPSITNDLCKEAKNVEQRPPTTRLVLIPVCTSSQKLFAQISRCKSVICHSALIWGKYGKIRLAKIKLQLVAAVGE